MIYNFKHCINESFIFSEMGTVYTLLSQMDNKYYMVIAIVMYTAITL